MLAAFAQRPRLWEIWTQLMENEWLRVMISFAIRQILRWLQL